LLHDVTFMTSIISWLLAALAIGLVTWRVAIARRRSASTPAERENATQAALLAARKVALKAGQMPSATEPVNAAPAAKASAADIEAARATARAKADRVIAAEAARRKAAIHKAQNVARVEAERRAAKAAEAASALATTIPLDAPAVAQPPRPSPVPAGAPAARKVAKFPAEPVVAPPAPTPMPVAARTLATATIVRPAPAAPRAPAVATVLKSAAQTLILLVDDSKMVRVKSSRLLAAHEFQVVTAVDGVDALKQLETCCPDLVITDVDMPGMDGFDLTNALRANPRTQHIPVVMITSAEDRHRDEALRVGVGLVLGKPYDEAALVAHIRSFKFFARAEDVETLACA
jgi:CheY-like chemotaxis protein